MENKINRIGLLAAIILLSGINIVSFNQLSHNTDQFIIRPVKVLVSKRKAESKRKNAEAKSELHNKKIATIDKYAAYQRERLAFEKTRKEAPRLSNKTVPIMDNSKVKSFYIDTRDNGVDKSGVIPYGR